MPAVRPVPTGGALPTKPPIESLSFDSLLEDARQTGEQTGTRSVSLSEVDPTTPSKGEESTDQSVQSTRPDALAPLNGIESIRNASLRRIVADAAGR